MMKPMVATTATLPSSPISITRMPSDATVDCARTALKPVARNASNAAMAMVIMPKITSVAPKAGTVANTGSNRASRKTPSFTIVAECR